MEQLSEKLKKYRLNESEYQLIIDRLGRPPEGVEWAVFSALWSEHCSYKSSKVHLKKFQKTLKNVVASMGENAGVIDLGQGERLAFKMESHNHPSYIEPYQGAATGVGGILRDIFTMGARPIALANYLCFGDPEFPRMKRLIDGVVRGIGGYGNCVGVPMLTGQTEIDPSYNHNILVNALAVGYLGPNDKMASAQTAKVGAKVVYVGAKTGRDGIHGASMASQSFDAKSSAQRPTVQIGDPFYEKLLIESCIEVIQQNLVIAIQDMGAAGLTSSSFEMASSGGVGLRMDLDRIPLRDQTLTPEDILLSESQERMLLICDEAKFPQIEKVFKNWDLDAVIVGEVIKESEVVLSWHNEIIARIDPKKVVDRAPMYERKFEPWVAKNRVQPSELKTGDAKKLLESPNYKGASKKFIFDQYDQRVGASTFMDCNEPVGAVRLPSGRGMGLALGCRPTIMRWDAKQGALDSIALPAIKLAAFGFESKGATDCLNFGNPEKLEIMTEFVASVDAITEICQLLSIPVVSGNVSFYNQTSGKDITSTPAIGIVGLKENLNHLPASKFIHAGDEVICLSIAEAATNGELGYGEINLQKVKGLIDVLLEANKKSLVRSANVAGELGLLWTLSKMISSQVGVKLSPEHTQFLNSAVCRFYDVIVSVQPSDVKAFESIAHKHGISAMILGQTTKSPELVLENNKWTFTELSSRRDAAWVKGLE